MRLMSCFLSQPPSSFEFFFFAIMKLYLINLYLPDSKIKIQAPLKKRKMPKQNSTLFPKALI